MGRRGLAWGLAAILACCGCLGGGAAEAEGRAAGTLYLRVIARNDSAEAQAEKHRARDAVIAACPALCADPDALLPLVGRAAEAYEPCKVEIRMWTPGGAVPPAPTVYITLAPGNGRNWWGVLYRGALLWARAEEEAETVDQGEPDAVNQQAPETADQRKPEAETWPPQSDPAEDGAAGDRVVFVWPLLAWLRNLLGL